MSEITLHNASRVSPAAQRAASVVSCALGVAGLLYWLPALFLRSPETGSGSPYPGPIIQRVASMALEQYTPNMGLVVPILGALFCLASAIQIPAGAGAAMGRELALNVLRVVSYTKLGLYITSGLLLGLAIFSSVRAGDPSWSFSALNWIANLGIVGIYYWLVRTLAPPPAEEAFEEELAEEEADAEPE